MPLLKLSSLRGAALLSVLLLSGCSHLGFYAQAVHGHVALMRARVPIDAAIADPAVSSQTKRLLNLAAEARRYAHSSLSLPDNGSYTAWVALDRPAVTWNVVATPAHSLVPERWCFPVAGCLSYRGYFERERAERFAERLAEQGLDVAVNGASAYSSLGWFRDPVVSTMFRGGDVALVGVVFHELAHQQLYVSDDSSFNESFATFVEMAGVERWLSESGRAQRIEPWRRQRARRSEFIDLLTESRQRLSAVYAAGGDTAELDAAKQAELQRLNQAYSELKSSWGGYSGYDGWFARPVNNARLAGVGTYTQWVGAFAELYAQSGQDFARFYDAAAALGSLPPDQRHARLVSLSPSQGL